MDEEVDKITEAFGEANLRKGAKEGCAIENGEVRKTEDEMTEKGKEEKDAEQNEAVVGESAAASGRRRRRRRARPKKMNREHRQGRKLGVKGGQLRKKRDTRSTKSVRRGEEETLCAKAAEEEALCANAAEEEALCAKAAEEEALCAKAAEIDARIADAKARFFEESAARMEEIKARAEEKEPAEEIKTHTAEVQTVEEQAQRHKAMTLRALQSGLLREQVDPADDRCEFLRRAKIGGGPWFELAITLQHYDTEFCTHATEREKERDQFSELQRHLKSLKQTGSKPIARVAVQRSDPTNMAFNKLDIYIHDQGHGGRRCIAVVDRARTLLKVVTVLPSPFDIITQMNIDRRHGRAKVKKRNGSFCTYQETLADLTTRLETSLQGDFQSLV